MSTVRKIGRNVSLLSAGNLIQKFLSFVMVVYLAQKLGVANFGVYSFAFSFVLLFTVFSDLGVGTLIFREIAKDKTKASELLGDAFVIKLILFLPVLLFIFLSVLFLHFFDPLQYPLIIVFFVFIAALSLLLDSLAGLFRMVFFAFQEMQYEFFANIFYKLLLVFLTAGILFLGFGLKEVFFVALFSSGANFALSSFVAVKKFVKPKISFSFLRYKKLVLAGLPFCFLGVFMSIYGSIDSVMLSFFKGNVSVGYYSAAMRLINTLSFIPTALMSAIFPVMASFHASSNKSLNVVISKSFKYLLVVVLPIAFATTLLSERIIGLIYPTTELNNFAPAALALKILIWFSVLNFLNLIFLNSLQSTAFEKKASMIVAVSLAINILFNLFLIPVYDFAGAALASVLSEIVFFCLGAYFISKYFFDFLSFLKTLIKPLIASLTIFAFIYFFFFLNIFVLLLFSAVIYFVVLFLIKGFDKKDISFFRKLVSK
jgi:O-antigen/teichoic acid export membrane protein